MQNYYNSTRSECWAGCNKCPLHTTRRNVVVRRSGIVTRGCLGSVDLDLYPFNKDQRQLVSERLELAKFLVTSPKGEKLYTKPTHPCNCKHPFRPVHHDQGCQSLIKVPIPHVLLLSEAPGRVEDINGKPFMGESGYQLNCMLHLTQSTFFYTITNTVCCWPNNGGKQRQPNHEEKEACKPHIFQLLTQQEINGVICLGEVAHEYWTKLKLSTPTLHITHPAKYLRMDYRYLPQKIDARKVDKWIQQL